MSYARGSLAGIVYTVSARRVYCTRAASMYVVRNWDSRLPFQHPVGTSKAGHNAVAPALCITKGVCNNTACLVQASSFSEAGFLYFFVGACTCKCVFSAWGERRGTALTGTRPRCAVGVSCGRALCGSACHPFQIPVRVCFRSLGQVLNRALITTSRFFRH